MEAGDLSSILTKEERSVLSEHSEEAIWRVVAPRLIHDTLRRLFEDKHLYQSAEIVDFAPAKQIIAYWRELPPNIGSINWSTGGGASTWSSDSRPVREESAESKEQSARTELIKVLAAPWRAEVLRSPNGLRISGGQSTFAAPAKQGKDAKEVEFPAPRAVRTYCHVCGERTPFNPVSFFGFEAAEGWTGAGRSDDEQHFGYSYECQQCPGPKRGRVVFLVVRRGGKITLCGREPLEAVAVQAHIPKPLQKFVSGALVAHHAGQTLSGLFQLRTFIEQFWRLVSRVEQVRLEALQGGKRLSGDELAEIYAKGLPEPFKAQFPSLGKIYSDLSAAMHDAKQGDEAAAVFTTGLEEINEHFDARRLYKLIL